MGRLIKTRYRLMLMVFTCLMAILVIRLFTLTVISHDKWVDKAENLSTKTITTSAPRGNIYDRNGNVLATNRQVFNVRMYSSDEEDKDVNQVCLDLTYLLDRNGDEIKDDFPIKLKNGKYYYTYDEEIRKWLRSENMPESYTAEQAFNQLRSNLNISADADVYQAQLEMQTNYGVYPPISVGAVISYTYDNERKTFLERYGLDEDTGASEAFSEIRKAFGVEDSYSPSKARKIIVIRDALKKMGYTKYLPVTIASEVSSESIIAIEEETSVYRNVEVASEYIRSYPNGAFASHILGYMGSISDADKDEYVNQKGYGADDLIGKDGIESVYESSLRGEDGTKTVKVDVFGNLVENISETDPVAGKNVYLTIDKDIQKSVERNLEKGIRAVSSGGTFTSEYGNYATNGTSKCKSGAAVVLDVKTSEVLGMASYPDFDPNLFAAGISDEDWNDLQTDNVRDPLSAQPLYNIATRSAVQPGSTFKPVTATAAMANGLNPRRYLVDGGQVKVGDTTYDCLIYTNTHTTHGAVDMAKAIGVSCNYYFYDIGQGKDYYTGSSLGYKCGVDEIIKYAKLYGLGEETGIELTEASTTVPSAERKMQGVISAVENLLWTKSDQYFTKKARSDEEVLSGYISTIAGWCEENPSLEEIMKRLPSNGVKENKVYTVAETIKFSYFEQAGWTEGDALNISIGQGENAYTPLQLANYVATIGNNGIHNKVSVVKSVGGQGVKKTEKGSDIGIEKSLYSYLIEGMKNVCTIQGGSLTGLFSDFPYSVAAKTGTAERAGKINPPDEVEYVKEHLSQWTSSITWKQVEKEMNRIMELYPNTYKSRDVAVRQAVYNLTEGKVTGSIMDASKPTYENFAWTIALAPADDPQIAVCVLLVQGKASSNAGVIVREIIGDYMKLQDKNDYKTITIGNEID